jgi:hypothetical protein
MLTEELMNNWAGTPSGMFMSVVSLSKEGYETWTLKNRSEYGVAVPIETDEDISEYFSGAHLYTDKRVLNGETEKNFLFLTSDKEDIIEPFSALCAEMITPGQNGELRRELESNPLAWWARWRELLGNKNVDFRAYDVLGELWVLKYLAEHGEQAEWNGPNGATYDIDCGGYYAEVKSTTARNKKQITLSNLFQLDPPDGAKLYLMLCQFESAQEGISINSLVQDLEELGYSSSGLNEKLSKLGLEKGKTARKRNYAIIAVTKYLIDENFPAIRRSSFIGGDLPEGVMNITYTVTLDGIIGEIIN